jgi:uncharacterized DUF497 family protein
MRIVWDEPKRQANIVKHDGLDFAALTTEFFEAATILPAKKGRFQAIGRLADGTVVVIFATLGAEAISIISMRRAKKEEGRLI